MGGDDQGVPQCAEYASFEQSHLHMHRQDCCVDVTMCELMPWQGLLLRQSLFLVLSLIGLSVACRWAFQNQAALPCVP